MPQQSDIPNSIIGGIVASLGISLFIYTHNHRLNLSDILWAMTAFREKWLPEYFPLVAGIFFISGVLFDCLQYDSFNAFSPYGPRQHILARTSMYGFAFSGFCIGLGSKLTEGDIIYHGLIGIARGSIRSLTVTLVVIAFAVLWSWLLDAQLINFFADSKVNPEMAFMHIQSANINIGLACVLLIVSFCLLRSNEEDVKVVLKKMGGSFIAGILLALGFLVCGLSRRTLVFQSLTPGSNWNPALLIFTLVVISLNFITYQLFFKKIVLNNEDAADNAIFSSAKHREGLNLKAILGSILIGTGWGVAGLDLTTYFIHSAIFSIPVVVIFGLFLILGTMIGDNFQQMIE